jgi:hypothetical protein
VVVATRLLIHLTVETVVAEQTQAELTPHWAHEIIMLLLVLVELLVLRPTLVLAHPTVEQVALALLVLLLPLAAAVVRVLAETMQETVLVVVLQQTLETLVRL